MIVFLSFIILVALIVARSFSVRNRKWHVKLMSLVVLSDVSLVLFLAMGRNVLEKVGPSMSGLLIFHICLAITVVVAYVLSAYWGIQLAKGNESLRSRMRIIDKIVLPTRTLVFLTALILTLIK